MHVESKQKSIILIKYVYCLKVIEEMPTARPIFYDLWTTYVCEILRLFECV